MKRTPKGFTLLEYVLYFALISIVITAVVSFALDFTKTRSKARVIAETENNTRLAAARILRAVRRSDSLNVGSSTFDADSGVLALAMSATATNPTVFDLSAGAVRIKEGTGVATPLTTSDVNVSRLRFSRDNLPGGEVTITVQVMASYVNPSSDSELNYSISTSATAMIRKQGS